MAFAPDLAFFYTLPGVERGLLSYTDESLCCMPDRALCCFSLYYLLLLKRYCTWSLQALFPWGGNAVQSCHCYSDSFIVICRSCHPFEERQVLLFLMHDKQCMEVGMYQHFILVRKGLICFCWWSYFSISSSLSRLLLASGSCPIFPLQVIRGSWTTSTKMALTVPLDNVMANQGIPGEISMPPIPFQYAPLSHPHIYNKYCLTVNRKCCCRPAGFPELVWSLCSFLLNKLATSASYLVEVLPPTSPSEDKRDIETDKKEIEINWGKKGAEI